MPPHVFARKHRSQVLDPVIRVDAVDVVDMEPGVQEMIVFPLPDDVRAHDLAAPVGVRMNRAMDVISPAGSLGGGASGYAYVGFLGQSLVPSGFASLGDAHLDRNLRLTEMTVRMRFPTRLFNRVAHIRLYPGQCLWTSLAP